jgi:hypothetical protein
VHNFCGYTCRFKTVINLNVTCSKEKFHPLLKLNADQLSKKLMTITNNNMICSDTVIVTGSIIFKIVLFTFLHNMFGLLPIYGHELKLSRNKFLFNKIRFVKCTSS